MDLAINSWDIPDRRHWFAPKLQAAGDRSPGPTPDHNLDFSPENASGVVDFRDRQRRAEKMFGLGDCRHPRAGEKDTYPPWVRLRCMTDDRLSRP
jgi:hypothetical protein